MGSCPKRFGRLDRRAWLVCPCRSSGGWSGRRPGAPPGAAALTLLRAAYAVAGSPSVPWSIRRARLCNWQTLLSVTPISLPISFSCLRE